MFVVRNVQPAAPVLPVVVQPGKPGGVPAAREGLPVLRLQRG